MLNFKKKIGFRIEMIKKSEIYTKKLEALKQQPKTLQNAFEQVAASWRALLWAVYEQLFSKKP